MVPLEFVPAAPDVAVAFVYLFSDAFACGFASVMSLTLGVAFGSRLRSGGFLGFRGGL